MVRPLQLTLWFHEYVNSNSYVIIASSLIAYFRHYFYPARACAARGYVIGRGVLVVSINLHFFWNQSFISQNTHFQRSILTHIGFSSNLMASGTA